MSSGDGKKAQAITTATAASLVARALASPDLLCFGQMKAKQRLPDRQELTRTSSSTSTAFHEFLRVGNKKYHRPIPHRDAKREHVLGRHSQEFRIYLTAIKGEKRRGLLIDSGADIIEARQRQDIDKTDTRPRHDRDTTGTSPRQHRDNTKTTPKHHRDFTKKRHRPDRDTTETRPRQDRDITETRPGHPE